jgi:hypothetical protein
MRATPYERLTVIIAPDRGEAIMCGKPYGRLTAIRPDRGDDDAQRGPRTRTTGW